MNKYLEIIKNLISYKTEEKWFEFKENWYEAHGIGEYISALSNAAAICRREYAYLVWGINNEIHEVLGTKFNYRADVKDEPLKDLYVSQIKKKVRL